MQKTIYTKEHKKLIAKLIEARQTSLLKQEEVAKLIKKTQSYVSKIEAGQKKIEIIELINLAKIYKQDLHFFLD